MRVYRARKHVDVPHTRPPRSATLAWARNVEVLFGLGAAHGAEALVGALRRAVAFRRYRAADMRSILAAGAGTPHPRPPGDALILDLPVAPTRSLDAYTVTPAADGGVTS